MLGTLAVLLVLHRNIVELHIIWVQSGFAWAYPRLRRAKNGIFSIGVLPAPSKSCNMRALEALFVCRCAPKHAFTLRQTAMFAQKRSIRVPRDVD
jgi:hypothetical protein